MRRRRRELAGAGVEGVLNQAAIHAGNVKEVIPESSGCEYLEPVKIQALDDVVATTIKVAHIVAIDEEKDAGLAAADEKVLNRTRWLIDENSGASRAMIRIAIIE